VNLIRFITLVLYVFLRIRNCNLTWHEIAGYIGLLCLNNPVFQDAKKVFNIISKYGYCLLNCF